MRGMRRLLPVLFLLAAAALFLVGCGGQRQQVPGASGSRGKGLVMLDIGHFVGGEGACSPFSMNGKVLRECAFWYQYSYFVKKELEAAGYRCVVTNRGNAPTSSPLADYAKRARVVHLNHPDKNAARYPSRYFADRVGSGVISADAAIRMKADCAVFLHLNSSGGATSGGSNGLVICNRYNGRPLGEALCRAFNRHLLNSAMPNGGRICSVQVRYVDADRSAAWMNACDDAGIPAAVTEVAFVNNRDHARFLTTDAGARRLAHTVALGIIDFMKHRSSYPRHKRSNPNAPDEGSFGYAAESRRLNVPGAKHLL